MTILFKIKTFTNKFGLYFWYITRFSFLTVALNSEQMKLWKLPSCFRANKQTTNLQNTFRKDFITCSITSKRISWWRTMKEFERKQRFFLRIFKNNTVDLTLLFFTRTGLRNHEWPQKHQNIWSSVLLQFLQFWFQEVWWMVLYFNVIARLFLMSSCVLFLIWNINECLFVLLHSAAWTHHQVVNSLFLSRNFLSDRYFLDKSSLDETSGAARSDQSLRWTELIVFIYFVMFCVSVLRQRFIINEPYRLFLLKYSVIYFLKYLCTSVWRQSNKRQNI